MTPVEVVMAVLGLVAKLAPNLLAELTHHDDDAAALATARARLTARAPARERLADAAAARRAELEAAQAEAAARARVSAADVDVARRLLTSRALTAEERASIGRLVVHAGHGLALTLADEPAG